MLKKIIPSSGVMLPVIGLGTWQTFDVTESHYSDLTKVLTTMHAAGGRLIDSSPMYGKAEQVIGDITSVMNQKDDFFYATKVWVTGREEGIRQMESSMLKMKRKTIDLIQIHNLVDWKTHLKQLRKWKEEGRIKYIGITHYTDASHDELQKILRNEKLDFVQFNYSILNRNAEKGLLDVAYNNGVATLINRPFGEGSLFSKVKNKPLPHWAHEYGMETWADWYLKYIISHPAVTCVIPATGNAAHEEDNVKAGAGSMPDENVRKKMVAFMQSL